MGTLDDLIAAAKDAVAAFDRALSAYETAPPTKAEPVAWLYRYRDGTTYELTAKRQNYAEYKGLTETPLYAHPPAQSERVPREPTEAMVQAAYDISDEKRFFVDRLPDYWRAMHDAAMNAERKG